LCVTASVRQNAVRSSLDFPGLLLFFVEIMPDKVILDHKKSYLVILGSPGRNSVQKQISQNTYKNTPEDDLETFCDIISNLTSKYRPDFLGLGKLLDRSGSDFDEH